MCSAGSGIRTFVVWPHILHNCCCLITGYHFPQGSCAFPLIPPFPPFIHSSSSPVPSLILSPPQPKPFTCLLQTIILSLLPLPSATPRSPFFYPYLLLLISPLQPLSSYLLSSLPQSSPPLLLDRLLSEMAAGSSVAQLGINKHLDIFLQSPSHVSPFFFLSCIILFFFSSTKPHTQTCILLSPL